MDGADRAAPRRGQGGRHGRHRARRRGDTLYAFDAALGEERWRYSARGELAGAPAADGGLVHVGSRDRSLHTLDLTTGRLRWKLDTGGEIAGSPVAAEGRVFACSKDHCVYALDALLGTATAGNG
ncbi:PQQ-binding-like beta-propeller repeat protein [Streptacidiphilus monticola]